MQINNGQPSITDKTVGIRNLPFLQASTICLSQLVVKEGVIGILPESKEASLTVSGIVAIGLHNIGKEKIAQTLVENIKKSLKSNGRFVIERVDEPKRPHNWSNLWALLSILKVNPEAVSSEKIKNSILYLIKQQKKGGGWARVSTEPSKLYYTAHITIVLVKAYKLLSDFPKDQKKIKRSLKRAVGFILRNKISDDFLWNQNLDENSDTLHLPTTLASLEALSSCQHVLNKNIINSHQIEKLLEIEIKPAIRKLIESDAGNVQLREVKDGSFHTHLSPASIIYTLLRIGCTPLDHILFEILDWIKSNIVHHNGFEGVKDDAESSVKPVNWSTGHALISIATWDKILCESVIGKDFFGYLYNIVKTDHLVDKNVNLLKQYKKLENKNIQNNRNRKIWIRIALLSIALNLIMIGVPIYNKYGPASKPFYMVMFVIGLSTLLITYIATMDKVNDRIMKAYKYIFNR